jgi:hypothetical protein
MCVLYFCLRLCLCVSVPASPSLRKALDIPFYRYKEMPSYIMGV